MSTQGTAEGSTLAPQPVQPVQPAGQDDPHQRRTLTQVREQNHEPAPEQAGEQAPQGWRIGNEDEQARLAVLGSYDVLDQPSDGELDALVRAAAVLAGVPTAALNLLDRTRQCHLATVGFTGADSPRSESLCQRAVQTAAVVHLPDARQEPAYASSGWVDGRLGRVRFYASAPLVNPEGFTLGTLCVFDTVPRRLSAEQIRALEDLAVVAVTLLEGRRQRRRAERLAAESEQRRLLTAAVLESVEVGIVAADAAGHLTLFNRTARSWHGSDADAAAGPEEFAGRYDLHREDDGATLPAREVPLVRALRGEQVRRQGLLITAHGQPQRTVEATGRALQRADGTLAGAVVVMHDVTEQRHAAAREAATRERLQALLRAQADIAAADLVPEAVMDRICAGAQHLSAATGAVLLEADVEHQQLHLRAITGTVGAPTAGAPGRSGPSRQLPLPTSLSQQALHRAGAVSTHHRAQCLSPDPGRGPSVGSRFSDIAALGARSAVAVPLLHAGVAGEQCVGVLLVTSVHADAFDDDDVDALNLLAAPSAAALVNARTMQQISHVAATDALTGLANRASTVRALEQALARQERHGGHLAVLFLDLDGFKAVNDTFGHRAGDDLLVQVADRIKATLRTGDTPGRYGGDEFIVVAEGLSEPEHAHLLAERLQRAIAGQYSLTGADTAGEGCTASIGTSIGVAVAPEPAGRTTPGDSGSPRHSDPTRSFVDQTTALLMAADEAMYDDKEARRHGR